MSAVLKKVGDHHWEIIDKNEDGTFADYRFYTMKEALQWARLVGMEVEVVK